MNGPLRLGVNIDHVATIRQARGTEYPDPVEAALIAERAGAGGITAHLREDRRHIQDRDVERLRDAVTTKLNLEMAAADEMIAIACRLNPDDCCLVPERREELTTEGGLRVAGNEKPLRDVVMRLSDAGIRVSLFIDPNPAEIAASAAVGATVVELHTGTYAEAVARGTEEARNAELDRLRRGAVLARRAGLVVNAGHGLTVGNVAPVAALPEMVELNIGHSIVARAVLVGIAEAVREMLAACRSARRT
jgi:pyridoxine 5-phosphate synthase